MKKSNILTVSLAVAATTLMVSGSALARGTVTGLVDKITAGSSNTNVFLKSKIEAVNGEIIPSCGAGSQAMTLSADQKSQLAILLTALALETEVRIVGTGRCEIKSSQEDVSFVQVISAN